MGSLRKRGEGGVLLHHLRVHHRLRSLRVSAEKGDTIIVERDIIRGRTIAGEVVMIEGREADLDYT